MARPTRTSLGHALGARPAGSPISPLLTGARTILALGDSITKGYLPGGATIEGGWRVEIASRIAQAGFDWTFVGPYTDVGDHCGVNSRTTATLNGNIATTLGAGFYEPDLVVLMSGTNDVIDPGYDGPTSMYYMDNILLQIDTLLPSTRVVVCSRLPTVLGAYVGYAPNVDDWNSRIDACLDGTTIHSEGRLLRVPIGDYIRAAHVAHDGVHPTQEAYGIMASAYWPAICNAMGADAEW